MRYDVRMREQSEEKKCEVQRYACIATAAHLTRVSTDPKIRGWQHDRDMVKPRRKACTWAKRGLDWIARQEDSRQDVAAVDVTVDARTGDATAKAAAVVGIGSTPGSHTFTRPTAEFACRTWQAEKGHQQRLLPARHPSRLPTHYNKRQHEQRL